MMIYKGGNNCAICCMCMSRRVMIIIILIITEEYWSINFFISMEDLPENHIFTVRDGRFLLKDCFIKLFIIIIILYLIVTYFRGT